MTLSEGLRKESSIIDEFDLVYLVIPALYKNFRTGMASAAKIFGLHGTSDEAMVLNGSMQDTEYTRMGMAGGIAMLIELTTLTPCAYLEWCF